MTDGNGKEIRNGDVVVISGSYKGKNDGTYRVTSTPGVLVEKRNDARIKIVSSPLFCAPNDEERRKANEHNEKHTKIEILN